MTGTTITEVDPFDDDLTPWHAIYVAALEHAVGDAAQAYTLPELRAQLREPTADRRIVGFVGRDAGGPVVSGVLTMSMVDHPTSAFVDVTVLPAEQRRGHGRRMLAHLEERAAAEGRTTLTAEVRWPNELGGDGAGSAGAAFAQAHGYRLGLGDVQRRLDRPVPDDVLDRLSAEAAPYHVGYELRSWVGPVPDELAVRWLALSNSLMTEAPVGEMSYEVENADVAVLRDREASLARQGRTAFHTVALDAAGEVVAYTEIVHGVHDRSSAFQWGTLVRRDHRGHRLGLAVKAANHRLFQRHRPDVGRVTTWNAEVNDHMVAVNDRFGFRPVSRMGEFQKAR